MSLTPSAGAQLASRRREPAENRVTRAKPEAQRTEGPGRPASCGTERISEDPRRDHRVPTTGATRCQGCSAGLALERSPLTEITDNSLKPAQLFLTEETGKAEAVLCRLAVCMASAFPLALR